MTNRPESPNTELTRILFGFMTSQAIATAARLGVADALSAGPRTVEELAASLKVDRTALARLLRSTASVGVFAERDGRIAQTELSERLCSNAADSLRDFAIYMGCDWHWNIWSGLEYSVRHGKPEFERAHGKSFFEWLPTQAEPARVFHAAMTSFSAAASEPIVAAYDFSPLRKLVDVGGGHGHLLAAVLKQYPLLAGVVYDAPPVVEGARGRIQELGLEGRCEAIGGDFFSGVPRGGDAYMMKHIIHDWNDELSIRILRHCRESMNPGGRVLIVEMVVPEGDSPALGKQLDLEMLLFLHSFERTAKQYESLLRAAGFDGVRCYPTNSAYSIVEGTCSR